MEQVLASTPFKVYAAVVAVLVLKLAFLSVGTAIARRIDKRTHNPEDAKLFGIETGEGPLVERVRRAHLNSLENELPFMVIGLLYFFVGSTQMGMMAYAYTFLFARIAHTVFYVTKLQPWRTISYLIGWLCLIGMSVKVLLGAFGG